MISWTIDGLELTSRGVWQRYGIDITNNIEKDWVVWWIVSLWMEEEGVAVEEAVGEAGAGRRCGAGQRRLQAAPRPAGAECLGR